MAKFIDKFLGNTKKNETKDDKKPYVNSEENKIKEEVDNSSNSSSEERKIAKLQLSATPEMESTMSDFQKEFILEELEELPPIMEGDLNIWTTYIFDMGDKFEVGVYIRNGLQKPVNLELVPLNITDKENNIVGRKVFNLKEIGIIPSMSARPWKIYFEKEIVQVPALNKDDFKIVFDLNIKAKATVELEIENLPENMNSQEKQKYISFLKNLPAIGPNEISISTYSLTKDQQENLEIILLIRNGSSKQVKLEALPVKVVTMDGQEVVGGIFDFKEEPITINERKAILHRFIFPSENIANQEINLKECKVLFTSNQ